MTTSTRRQMIGALVTLGVAGVALSAVAQASAPAAIANPVPKTARPMKIGVIGSGRVGSILGELWLRAGHDVMFSDRDPAAVKAVTDRLPTARGGTSPEAIAFADVLLLTVPYAAMPAISKELGPLLRGKTVIDTSNPYPPTGPLAELARAKGTGVVTAELLPGVRVARAFSTFSYLDMGRHAHRPGEKVGVMIAAADGPTMSLAERLVRDAGFDPLAVGDLASSKRFEFPGPTMGPRTATELRGLLDKTS